MSEPQAYSSIYPPPPPPPRSTGWYCDSCHRANSMSRYQCQQCRGYNNTYDLCETCIGRTAQIHPGHTFALLPSSPFIAYAAAAPAAAAPAEPSAGDN